MTHYPEFLDNEAFGRNVSIRAKLSEALLLFVRSFHPSTLSKATVGERQSNQLDWEIIRYVNANFFHDNLETVGNGTACLVNKVSNPYTNIEPPPS